MMVMIVALRARYLLVATPNGLYLIFGQSVGIRLNPEVTFITQVCS